MDFFHLLEKMQQKKRQIFVFQWQTNSTNFYLKLFKNATVKTAKPTLKEPKINEDKKVFNSAGISRQK